MTADTTPVPTDVAMEPCTCCWMPCAPGEYHPYAACLMFKACNNSETVRANLDDVRRAQPAPAASPAPLTDIRKAALALYTPPFRHEYGFIRDSNNEIVADDASSAATGLIAARIRGWGRIQYMDNPAGRANALQDEMADMVAEALNAYWAGIKEQ